MKTLSILMILFVFSGIPANVFSQGYAILSKESLNSLIVLSVDARSSSFVVTNREGEQVKGYTGDFLGHEESQVIEVTDKYVTLETVEHFYDTDGNQREQRSRMQVPVSLSLDGNGKGAKNDQ